MSAETEAVSFPTWKSVLASTGWPEAKQAEYRREIFGFLHLCKVRRAPATIMPVKDYLAECARQGPNAARRRGTGGLYGGFFGPDGGCFLETRRGRRVPRVNRRPGPVLPPGKSAFVFSAFSVVK
jgi:hypothetical protein